MSHNYVYAVALTHPFISDPVPIEAFERVCIELPRIVQGLFGINRETTRGYWLEDELYVRTTDPIFYAYQAQQFPVQFLYPWAFETGTLCRFQIAQHGLIF